MSNHNPVEDFATALGETLLECIEALGMSQMELATRTGLDEKTINLIIKGAEPITDETALAPTSWGSRGALALRDNSLSW